MAGRFEGPVGTHEPHPDEDIVVYHSTSPENAEHLRKHGTTRPKPVVDESPMIKQMREISPKHAEAYQQALKAHYGDEVGMPGQGRSPGLYVTRHPAEGGLYGTHSVPVRIKTRDLGVSEEMKGSTPWKALNQAEGYIPGILHPQQFGEVYTAADHRHWDNQHG